MYTSLGRGGARQFWESLPPDSCEGGEAGGTTLSTPPPLRKTPVPQEAGARCPTRFPDEDPAG